MAHNIMKKFDINDYSRPSHLDLVAT